MSDWTDDFTAEERERWEEFVRHAQTDVVTGMASSAFVMSLVPNDKMDIKFAVELGVAIMLNKPIVALAAPGIEVPDGLRRVAHGVIELTKDLDTEAGQTEMQTALQTEMAALKAGGWL